MRNQSKVFVLDHFQKKQKIIKLFDNFIFCLLKITHAFWEVNREKPTELMTNANFLKKAKSGKTVILGTRLLTQVRQLFIMWQWCKVTLH